MKFNFTIIILLFAHSINAQNLTGTWQGEMDGYEFLQLNIIQIGNNLCGYSYDYELNDKKSYCKAYFSGSYSQQLDAWFIEGSSFMEQGSGHVLMQIKFKIESENGKKVLKGLCRIKPSLFLGSSEPSSFVLKQTSRRPTIITETMRDCMAQFEPPPKKVTPKKSRLKSLFFLYAL